jgi:acetyl esterase/lipase
MAMRLDLYLPEKRPTTPGPAVLWIHGGGWKQGSKEQCPLVWLAAEGIPVASIEYRFSWQARWPAQLDDCRAAMAWMHSEAAQHVIDPRRIFVAGASAGGHLATLVGTTGNGANGAAGVINFYGASNLFTMPPNVPGPGNVPEKLAATNGARLLGGPVHERPDLAREASGLFHVSAEDPPFLLIHGDRDPLVPLDQSTTLDAAIRDAGVPSRLVVLPGAGHGGPPFDGDDVRRSIREFIHTSARGSTGPVPDGDR